MIRRWARDRQRPRAPHCWRWSPTDKTRHLKKCAIAVWGPKWNMAPLHFHSGRHASRRSVFGLLGSVCRQQPPWWRWRRPPAAATSQLSFISLLSDGKKGRLTGSYLFPRRRTWRSLLVAPIFIEFFFGLYPVWLDFTRFGVRSIKRLGRLYLSSFSWSLVTERVAHPICRLSLHNENCRLKWIVCTAIRTGNPTITVDPNQVLTAGLVGLHFPCPASFDAAFIQFLNSSF